MYTVDEPLSKVDVYDLNLKIFIVTNICCESVSEPCTYHHIGPHSEFADALKGSDQPSGRPPAIEGGSVGTATTTAAPTASLDRDSAFFITEGALEEWGKV